MHKTSAGPLTLVYLALVVYASLYPFADWRDQGLVPWSYLLAPLPRYWTGFDVAINIAGYAPWGALLALLAVRLGWRHTLLAPVLAGLVLSSTMEALQSYLPARVASREDLIFNGVGTAAGAVATLALDRMGLLRRWSRLRKRWFVEPSRGGIVLLATWPLALLFPAAVPFGLGQVFFRMQEAVAAQLESTPFAGWLTVHPATPQPLVPAAEMVCVGLGLMIPCLLGYCVIHSVRRRALLVGVVLAIGTLVTALSSALSWGPGHAWAWLGLPSQWGMALAVLAALGLVGVRWRASASLLLLALGIYLSLLNQAPESPYFSQTLHAWEQGRFIRFHGLAQWLGWLWPYATLLYVLSLMGRNEPQPRIYT